MRPSKPEWPTIDLVTPLEEIGYGDGKPHEPIPEPGPLFWLSLLLTAWVVFHIVIWLKS